MSEIIEIDHLFFRRYRWGIIDASFRDEVPDSWNPQPIAPKFLGNDIGRCPLLVNLTALPEDCQYALLDRLETSEDRDGLFSLVLESDADIDRLLIHLRKRLEVRVSGDQSPLQFRYYDPGTFLLLPGVLGDSGMRWLFGPIVSIGVPWCGEWRRYSRPAVPDHGRFNLLGYLPSLLTLGIINRVLVQLEIGSQDEWLNCAAISHQYIARAQSHGLNTRDDQVAFAIHAWTYHPNFDDHRTIRDLLTKLASATPEDEIDYRELSARLSETDWEKIVLELKNPSQGTGR